MRFAEPQLGLRVCVCVCVLEFILTLLRRKFSSAGMVISHVFYLADWLHTEIFIAWCNDFPQLFNCVTRAEVQSTLSLAPLRMATYKSTLPVLQSTLHSPLHSSVCSLQSTVSRLQSAVCCLLSLAVGHVKSLSSGH